MRNKKKENAWCEGWIAGWNAQADMKKRACHIVMSSTGWWECDECGGTIDWDSYDPNDPPACNYCPTCGAKVIEE